MNKLRTRVTRQLYTLRENIDIHREELLGMDVERVGGGFLSHGCCCGGGGGGGGGDGCFFTGEDWVVEKGLP